MPVYQSALFVNNMMCGLLVLDEKQYYTGGDLAILAFSVLVCIIGVLIIMNKPAPKSSTDR